MATLKAIERRQKSSATISVTQPSKQLHKLVPLGDRSKLQQERSGRESAPRLHPVPHSKVPSKTLHPANVAVQDKIKAREAKTAVPLRVLGRTTHHNRTAQSGQGSKLGQTKSGQQRQVGHHRPRTQPLATHLPEKKTKKSKTRAVPSQLNHMSPFNPPPDS